MLELNQQPSDSACDALPTELKCLSNSETVSKCQGYNPGSSNLPINSLASDGYVFIFMTISHEGVLKLSKRFDVLQEDLKVVLGCLDYVLEKTVNMSPTLMPEKGSRWQDGVNETVDTDGDNQFLLSDNDFLHPPEEAGDDEGDTSDNSTLN